MSTDQKSRSYRSLEKIKSELKEYENTPSMTLRYIESQIHKIEDGKIQVDDSTRTMLGDTARVTWESFPDIRKVSQQRMEYILNASREFADKIGEIDTASSYNELLQTIAEKDNPKREHSRSGLSKKVAVFASILVGAAFFSVSSITGNVTLEDTSTIASNGALAIGIGIIVFGAFAFFSRKR